MLQIMGKQTTHESGKRVCASVYGNERNTTPIRVTNSNIQKPRAVEARAKKNSGFLHRKPPKLCEFTAVEKIVVS